MSIDEFYQDYLITEEFLDSDLEDYVDHYLHHEVSHAV